MDDEIVGFEMLWMWYDNKIIFLLLEFYERDTVIKLFFDAQLCWA